MENAPIPSVFDYTASTGRRLGAAIIDGAVMGGAGYLVARFVGMGPVAYTLNVVMFLAYVVLPVKISGATLGKKILGLRIVPADRVGEPLSWQQTILRYGLPFALSFAHLSMVAYVWAFRNSSRRHLYDLVARTRVLQKQQRLQPLKAPHHAGMALAALVAIASFALGWFPMSSQNALPNGGGFMNLTPPSK